MKKWLKRLLIGLAIIIAALGIWLWPVIRVLLDKGLPQGPEMRAYQGTNRDNLKAIYTALMLYHDNEERFPEAAGWMDAIAKQLKTNDLTPEEAQKKLYDPKTGTYGYAINDKVAGKYKGDIPDPKTVLVFPSKTGKKNAHGDAATANGEGIAIDGSFVPAPSARDSTEPLKGSD